MNRGLRVSLLAVAVALGATSAAQAGTLARATVDPAAPKLPIASHFLGFSAEYTGLLGMIGAPVTGPDRALAGLFSTLDQGNGAPLLRIGGGSADDAFWNPKGIKPPDGLKVSLGPVFTASLSAFQQLTRAPLILTLNLAHDRTSYATDWARAALEALGPKAITAFEIGNEPDVFPTRPLGKKRRARPKSYSPSDYAREFARFRAALDRIRPRPHLSGYDTCCLWDAQLPRFLRQERSHISMISTHEYPLSGCAAVPANQHPTIARLLGDTALYRAAARFNGLRRTGERFHVPIRITETNSSSCSGRSGVSDSMASALWGTNWLFLLALEGFSGVNFHVNGLYTPFRPAYSGGQFTVTAAPLYYAMLLFANATADRAQLLPQAFFVLRPRRGATVHLWGTYHAGELRLVIVNSSLHASGPVRLTVKHAIGAGTVRRLVAPSVRSRNRVSFAGQQLVNSPDGALTGAEISETARRRGSGSFSIDMPATSAALVTVPVRLPRHGH